MCAGSNSRANFYSRTLVGCDSTSCHDFFCVFHFYSRTLVGCDLRHFAVITPDCVFLLTHPCRVRPLYIVSMNSQSSKSSSRLNLFKEILSLRNFLFRFYRLFQANHPQFFHLFRFAAQPYDVKELRIFKSFKSVFSFSVTVNRFDHICLQQSLNQIRCRRSLQIKRFHDSAPAKDTLQSERRK